jgi:hypothetical protein
MIETKAEAKTDPRVPRTITAADIDAQGNVVVWDHGPRASGEDVKRDSPEYAALEADAKAWHEKNGDGPVPIVMDKGQAGHAIDVEPARYSLDPIDLDDSELAAEVKKIQDQRAAAKKAADEREAALQLAVDRKNAVTAVLANRQAKLAEEKAAKVQAARPTGAFADQPNTKTESGLAAAARIAEQKASDLEAEARRVAADPAATQDQKDRAVAAADAARTAAHQARAKATRSGV